MKSENATSQLKRFIVLLPRPRDEKYHDSSVFHGKLKKYLGNEKAPDLAFFADIVYIPRLPRSTSVLKCKSILAEYIESKSNKEQ